MTKRELAKLRKSMWTATREAVTLKLEPPPDDYTVDVWCDPVNGGEWQGLEVVTESARIAALARSALIIAEKRDKA